jgi:hypothetical protein
MRIEYSKRLLSFGRCRIVGITTPFVRMVALLIKRWRLSRSKEKSPSELFSGDARHRRKKTDARPAHEVRSLSNYPFPTVPFSHRFSVALLLACCAVFCSHNEWICRITSCAVLFLSQQICRHRIWDLPNTLMSSSLCRRPWSEDLVERDLTRGRWVGGRYTWDREEYMMVRAYRAAWGALSQKRCIVRHLFLKGSSTVDHTTRWWYAVWIYF